MKKGFLVVLVLAGLAIVSGRPNDGATGLGDTDGGEPVFICPCDLGGQCTDSPLESVKIQNMLKFDGTNKTIPWDAESNGRSSFVMAENLELDDKCRFQVVANLKNAKGCKQLAQVEFHFGLADDGQSFARNVYLAGNIYGRSKCRSSSQSFQKYIMTEYPDDERAAGPATCGDDTVAAVVEVKDDFFTLRSSTETEVQCSWEIDFIGIGEKMVNFRMARRDADQRPGNNGRGDEMRSAQAQAASARAQAARRQGQAARRATRLSGECGQCEA